MKSNKLSLINDHLNIILIRTNSQLVSTVFPVHSLFYCQSLKQLMISLETICDLIVNI